MREFNDDIDVSPSKAFQEYLKHYEFVAKQLVERLELVGKAPLDSMDNRILKDILENQLIPKLKEMGDVIYSAILAFNNENPVIPYSEQDILKAQLIQDEVSAFLRKAGVNLEYQQKPDKA